jgi:hypothetical protein
VISSRIIVGGRTFAMDGDLALRACVDAYFPPPPLHLLMFLFSFGMARVATCILLIVGNTIYRLLDYEQVSTSLLIYVG